MIGEMQNWPLRLTSLIDHAEREHGAREIVSRIHDGAVRRTNWQEVAREAHALSDYLIRIGIRPGDRVATLAANHGRHLVCWFGVIGVGGVLHTINPRFTDDQLAYVIAHAEDRIIFFDEVFRPVVDRIRSQVPCVERWISYETADGFDLMVANGDADRPWVEGDERDPALLCYTSGTTGKPKGVIYQHRSQLLHTMAQIQVDAFCYSRRTVSLPITPMFHANAWGIPFACAAVGAKLVLSAANDPAVLHRLIVDERVTHSCAVPTVWLNLIQYLERVGGDFGMLRMIAIGGSAAPRALLRRLTEMGIQVSHLWGMTETSPVGTVAALPPDWGERDETSKLDIMSRQGSAPFGMSIRTVNESGNALDRDGLSLGRLQVRGFWAISRYFKDNTGTAVDHDGWFDTGDMAIMHPDGTMQLADRAKDLIKSGGEWISSIELENAAVALPGINEAAAIAVSHPKWGERPLLIVVRDEGSSIGSAEILSLLGERLPKWWLPEDIQFVSELPKTATGKISKLILREIYGEGIH